MKVALFAFGVLIFLAAYSLVGYKLIHKSPLDEALTQCSKDCTGQYAFITSTGQTICKCVSIKEIVEVDPRPIKRSSKRER